jgi:predicted esterase
MEDKMLKILCLHGRRQNKEILKTKLGNLTRKLKKYATLTIVDAPHVVETDAGENAEAMGGIPSGRVWYRRHDDNTLDFNMLEESLEYLAKLWNENGGYDGIIGFSMGASLAGIISHRSSESVFSGLKFVVGAGGRDVPELLEGSQICPSIQSLHFAGKTDEIVSPEDSEMLSRRYSSAVFIEHERGHMWPTQAEYMNTIVEFVEQQSVAKLAAIS